MMNMRIKKYNVSNQIKSFESNQIADHDFIWYQIKPMIWFDLIRSKILPGLNFWKSFCIVKLTLATWFESDLKFSRMIQNDLNHDLKISWFDLIRWQMLAGDMIWKTRTKSNHSWFDSKLSNLIWLLPCKFCSLQSQNLIKFKPWLF